MPIANRSMTTSRNPTRAHLLMLGFIAFSTQRKHSEKIITTTKMDKAYILQLRTAARQHSSNSSSAFPW